MAKTEISEEIGPDTVIGIVTGSNETRELKAGEIFDTPEGMEAFRDAMERAKSFVPTPQPKP